MVPRAPPELIKGVKNMPITEELSLEHSLLTRILLVLNNMIMAPDSGPQPNMKLFAMACTMMKQVVDMRHMKFEEESIYPMFDNGELANFVSTLRVQHDEARKFVARMDTISKSGTLNQPQVEELKRDFVAFQTMITAHAAYEESILFTVIEGALSDEQMRELKSRGVKQEESLLGPNATQKVYDMLAEFEDMAGVTGLSFYTKKAL
jgi:hemerythrin-like domain-containing protein